MRRKFTQTFFLAPQEKGYFVLNDVFRYIEEFEASEVNSALPNGAAELPSTVTLASDPGLLLLSSNSRYEYEVEAIYYIFEELDC